MALMLALGSYVDLWHVGHGRAYQHNCVASRRLWALDCVLVLARWQPSLWLPVCVGVLLFLVHWHWFCVFSAIGTLRQLPIQFVLSKAG
jgi:hypothetical protein